MTEQHNSALSLLDYLKSWPLYLLPHHFISHLTYRFTRSTVLTQAVIRRFIRHYNVQMHEAQQEDTRSYPHFNAFFTRALKPELRPVAPATNQMACPVDGTISQIGKIQNDRLFQAKGREYTLLELLGGDNELAGYFSQGKFATLYLSPRDYHRIHMPCKGRLQHTIHIPGRLFSVAPHTTRVIPKLFARNERVVSLFETELGKLAVVLVGAINVGSIETVWEGQITPPRGRIITRKDYTQHNIILEKSAELGRFNMGSTVILLTQQQIQWQAELKAETAVKYGQPFGFQATH